MKSASEEFKKLRLMAEKSLIKSEELENVLAQVESTLSQIDVKKVSDKKDF